MELSTKAVESLIQRAKTTLSKKIKHTGKGKEMKLSSNKQNTIVMKNDLNRLEQVQKVNAPPISVNPNSEQRIRNKMDSFSPTLSWKELTLT